MTLSDTEPKTRRSREELRALIMEAGREVLQSEGLGNGIEHITFKRVFAHLEATRGLRVTNASVIRRIWDNQEDFQGELIGTIIDAQIDLEVAAVAESVEELTAHVDLSTPELRRGSLAEIIRVASANYLKAASGSDAAIQMALITYVLANPRSDAVAPRRGRFRRTDEWLSGEYQSIYLAALELVGWRIRPGLSIDDASDAITALADGVVMRMITDVDAARTITQIRPMDGAEVEWTLLAIGTNQIVEFFAEPDPAWSS